MYEYEIEVRATDKEGNEHKIKRYYVLPIMGRYRLKDTIEDKLKNDIDIIKYEQFDFTVLNWDEVYC